MLGFKAMAMAPVIGDIPDIIVGDEEQGTPSNVFVFPDAIDLDRYVSDPDETTTPGGIIWSYEPASTPNVYTFNGVDPLDTESPLSPGSKQIDTQDLDPVTSDSNPRTVTVRNEVASPVAVGSGLGPYSDLPSTGPQEMRAVYLHASDGSTFSSKTIFVYTDNDGYDRYSPEEEVVYSVNFRNTGLPSGWLFATLTGTVTQSAGSDGICLGVGLLGENDGNYAMPSQSITLVQNSVWETRVTVTTDQTTPRAAPCWMMVYDNFGTGASDEYGGEHFFLDNEASTNSPIDGVGRHNFKYFMMPVQMQTPQFSDDVNGYFNPLLDATNDFRIILRIFDIAVTGGGYGAELDSGNICFGDLTVVRHDLSDMSVVQTLMDVDAGFVDALSDNTQAGSAQIDDIFGESSVAFASGVATISPVGTNWSDPGTATTFRPGDKTVNFGSATGVENGDNWPLAWDAETIYYIEYELSAPDATAESDPPDVIRVGADVLTGELAFDNRLVPNTPDLSAGFNTRGLSSPRAGTPQKYACVWYSHSETSSSIQPDDGNRMRPRLDILCTTSLQPLGRATNTGAVRVHSCTVQQVTF
jgi:hypothetical protein